MSVTSPRHQTGCALARQNQSRGLLDPGRPHRPLRLSRSFSRRCEHTPCPPRLRLPEAFRANWSKHNSLEGTEQLHRLLSIRRARDKLGLRTALAHLPCPAHTGILHQEQLPAWVQSAMPGREVCDGSVEHASSAICQARASPTRQQQLEIPRNNRNQPVEVGPRELYKPSRSQRHASHKRGQRLYGKGCPQQPTAPAEGEASPWLPLPTGSKEKKAFSRSTTPSWKGHRQRTGPEAHHAGLLFLPGPRASLGALGVGTGQERGGRAGEEEAGAGSRQCPAVRPPL